MGTIFGRESSTRLPRLAAVCAMAGLLAATDGAAGRADRPDGVAEDAGPDAAVDFKRDVRPILARRCLRCHGPDRADGGLRLDAPDLALRGGTSGRRLLGGRPQESELYRRVTAQDDARVMPPDDERLTAEELDVLRRWIERGAVWPDLRAAAAAERREKFWKTVEPYLTLAEYYQRDGRSKLLGFCAALVAVLAIERLKVLHGKRHRWSRGRARRLFAAAAHVNPGLYALAAAAALVYEYRFHQQAKLAESQHRIAALEEQVDRLRLATNPRFAAAYGTPPVPIRPRHPDRLGGTYYRGNDERSPQLYNGGFYCTCKLHLSLCDAQGHALAIGDTLPAAGPHVRLELERAPGTTPLLFTDEILLGSCLSRQVLQPNDAPRDLDEPRWFRTLQSQQRWEALYPLGPPQGDALSGLIYLYKAGTPRDIDTLAYHYGIRYDLRVAEGRLAEGSTLWMGSLYIAGNLQLPLEGQMQLNEWFDWRPLPEIEGQNTTDPELLGIPEHAVATTPTAPASPAAEAREASGAAAEEGGRASAQERANPGTPSP